MPKIKLSDDHEKYFVIAFAVLELIGYLAVTKYRVNPENIQEEYGITDEQFWIYSSIYELVVISFILLFYMYYYYY